MYEPGHSILSFYLIDWLKMGSEPLPQLIEDYRKDLTTIMRNILVHEQMMDLNPVPVPVPVPATVPVPVPVVASVSSSSVTASSIFALANMASGAVSSTDAPPAVAMPASWARLTPAGQWVIGERDRPATEQNSSASVHQSSTSEDNASSSVQILPPAAAGAGVGGVVLVPEVRGGGGGGGDVKEPPPGGVIRPKIVDLVSSDDDSDSDNTGKAKEG